MITILLGAVGIALLVVLYYRADARELEERLDASERLRHDAERRHADDLRAVRGRAP